MSDIKNQTTKLPPPSGDATKAEKYIQQLVSLISQNKVTVIHTDLSLFDPTSLEDHYRIDLSDYQVEISHSKNPDTSEDSFVILFNNLKQVREGCSEKSILAYMHLNSSQFLQFKQVADEQVNRIKKAAEEKRFIEAMSPIDQALNNISSEITQNPATIEASINTNDSVDDIHSHSMKDETYWPPQKDSNPTTPKVDMMEWHAEEPVVKETIPTEDHPITNSFDSLPSISEHMNRFPLTEKSEVNAVEDATETKNINSPVF